MPTNYIATVLPFFFFKICDYFFERKMDDTKFPDIFAVETARSNKQYIHVAYREPLVMRLNDALSWWETHPNDLFCSNHLIVGNQEDIASFMQHHHYDLKEIEYTINDAFGIENRADEDFLILIAPESTSPLTVEKEDASSSYTTMEPQISFPVAAVSHKKPQDISYNPFNALKSFNSKVDTGYTPRVRLMNSKNEEKTSPKKRIIRKNITPETDTDTNNHHETVVPIKTKLKSLKDTQVLDITNYDWIRGTGARAIPKPSANDKTRLMHDTFPVVSKIKSQLDKLTLMMDG